MIHVFIGTKAQFIKMAPVIRELDAAGLPYNLIDTGQHWEITQSLIGTFGLRQPDVCLRPRGKNIATAGQAVWWFLQNLRLFAFDRRRIERDIFRGTGGVCLIHGDTLTTLISALFARRARIRVAHVESGLRSFDLLHPFPEELIRLIVMRLSDVLFAPDDVACRNLQGMKVRGRIVNTEGNTISDSVGYIAGCLNRPPGTPDRYALVTIHRAEMVYSRGRLNLLLDTLKLIPPDLTILFVVHDVTLNQLKRFDLYEQVERLPNLRMLPLQDYAGFQGLLHGAELLVTDGGSIQEEAGILDIPCLVLRKKTERPIAHNAVLSRYDLGTIRDFMSGYRSLRRGAGVKADQPSRRIVEYLRAEEREPVVQAGDAV